MSVLYDDVQGGISWNLSSLTICHSLTSTVTFLILIGYEALSLTVAMVIVSEWQIVSDDKFHEMPPPPPPPPDGPLNSQEYKSFDIYAVSIKISMTEYHHWINDLVDHLF